MKILKAGITIVVFSLVTTSQLYAQELESTEIEASPELTIVTNSGKDPKKMDLALWEYTTARPTLANFEEYLEQFPDGEFAQEAREKSKKLRLNANKLAAQNKALDDYRKKRVRNGLVLELAPRFSDVQPYIRSMLNSCGYQLVEPHRFAKRVYPTINISGALFNGRSDLEHSVTLNLSLVLTNKNREVKAREKMLSYRTSSIDAHSALNSAFEDIGAQMKSSGFCF